MGKGIPHVRMQKERIGALEAREDSNNRHRGIKNWNRWMI